MANSSFSPPETPNRLHQQIARQLRQAILSGEMAYGSKLPSARELAARFKTSAFTIQLALEPLAEEGLIERTRKRGSFVRGLPHQLVSIGVYFCSDFWEGNDAALYRELYKELSREFGADRIRHKLWIDHRPLEDQSDPLPDLQMAVQSKDIQGLIVGRANPFDIKWLGKSGLPTSVYTTSAIALPRVTFDWRQMLGQALGELHKQGCRSVGAIAPFPGPTALQGALQIDDLPFAELFAELAAGLGMTVRQEWIRTPSTPLPGSTDFEIYGYRQFHELWRQAERPEGLVVYPDTMVRGVVTAALQAGVSVPRDLKLVLHRNEGVSILCPLPASWLVTSVRQLSLSLLEQIKRQLAGKQVHPTYLSFGLEASDGVH